MKKLFTFFSAMVTVVALNAQSVDYENLGFYDEEQNQIEELRIGMGDDLSLNIGVLNNGPDALATGDSLLLNVAINGMGLGYAGWSTAELASNPGGSLVEVGTPWIATLGLFSADEMDQYVDYIGTDFEVCINITAKIANDVDPTNNEACIHVYRGTVGINDLAGEINVYPNPATDVINVANAEGAQISVFDINGRMISNIESASSNQTIDASGLAKGMYIVRIVDGNNVVTKKVNVVK
ncbi:MAG: T9SS type A sorting domain-containing protein [Bacteroidales bacterium]|nr:T9SS type A sorting domain-containing protein [Bacteroidales bacterium]